ncbi:hypothetical protein MED134_11301 [Dokdonia sp. MED134]|uniref:3-oxoacyl-ACP synthase n=1 Tax=Dokdonia sp. MED134 TaxID=313590 RepID=UPI000068DB70|nr:3-oxoacyl-ACP synthase [Dokdonia sp. MED134]EAQ38479.1 hypothetical protein MED134_11301 [Dokdonia sp. MED134]
MTHPEIKEELLKACKEHLMQRRDVVQQILDNVATSLREETKSTAGDKHETGRAMLQLERENAGKQLAAIEKLEQIFLRIKLDLSEGPVHLGSVVVTSQACYFISIPVGAIKVDGLTFYAIGIGSPIGQLLMGKREGDEVRFRESVIKITTIY